MQKQSDSQVSWLPDCRAALQLSRSAPNFSFSPTALLADGEVAWSIFKLYSKLPAQSPHSQAHPSKSYPTYALPITIFLAHLSPARFNCFLYLWPIYADFLPFPLILGRWQAAAYGINWLIYHFTQNIANFARLYRIDFANFAKTNILVRFVFVPMLLTNGINIRF